MSGKHAHICVVGAGPIGLTLAGILCQTHHVWLVVRPEHEELLANPSFSLCGTQQLDVASVKVTTATQLPVMPKDASFWIALKAYGLEAAVRQLLPRFSNTTPIVLLSNGLGIYMDIKPLIGRDIPVLRALPGFGALRLSDTKIKVCGELQMQLAGIKEDSLFLRNLADLLNSCKFNVTVEKDIASAEWKKAFINLVVNSICTIAGVENGILVENPALRALASKALAEIRAVAACEGFSFPELTDELIFARIRSVGENINSTLCDIRRQRRSETPYIMGRFLSIARSYRVATPVCETLAELLEAIEHRAPR